MESDKKKIEALIAEIKDHGENFDPERISTLPEVYADSPNINLVNNLINECRLGNIIDQPAKANLRPLDQVLRELWDEFGKEY